MDASLGGLSPVSERDRMMRAVVEHYQ